MKEIPLTQGMVALVDDEDYALVSGYEWVAVFNGKWYAMRWHSIRMHREIMNAEPDQEVDHINGNGLDNRKENLRIVTRTQNMQNATKRNGTSSQYKGVSRSGKRWRAYIRVNGMLYSLGSYENEEEAARVYDIAAKEHFGEYARTNFPN